MTKITKNAVLIRLSFSKAGNTRKGDLSKVETDADKSRLRLTKQLFDCPEFKAIGSFDGDLRGYINSLAVPIDAGFSGVSLLPLALLDRAEKRLTNAEIERAELVNAFVATYDAQREKARVQFGEQFNPADYPDKSIIAGQFGLRWAYVTFETPENLPAAVAEREKAKLEEKFREMEADVTAALRQSFADLLGHLTERLTPGEDGKRKIFRDSVVSNLTDFLELFAARNVTNDTQLAELAEKAKAIMGSCDPAALRDNAGIRDSIRAKADEIKTAVTALIADAPRRKFNLEE